MRKFYNMEFVVNKLNKNNKKDIDEVARIMYEWWGKSCNLSYDEQVKIIKSRSSEDYPITFIVKDLDEVIGTITLLESEILSRPELSPMIGGVYVKEEYRNKGIVSKLVNYMINYVRKNLDFKYIYLIANIEYFYEKFGFNILERINNDKDKIYILEVK